jgi:aerobic-type carbon monoxide dehydrogenase small subunit (CoxS/CutS family)
MPLLWALRDLLDLKGAKFGCGQGLCGACTVHLNGQAVRSCVVPVEAASGGEVLTIEGLAATPLARVQAAWVEAQVPQCGYCQPGMIMSVAALLQSAPGLSPAEARSRLTNICRCGTYDRINQAIATLFPAGKPASTGA